MESLKVHWTHTERAQHNPEQAFPFGGADELMLRGSAKRWAREPTGAKESDIDWAAYMKLERHDGALKVAEFNVHMVSLNPGCSVRSWAGT